MKDGKIQEMIRRTGIAREAILEHIKNEPADCIVHKGQHDSVVTGSLECPVCKQGKLYFRKYSSNGHIHAGCEKADCVNWME